MSPGSALDVIFIADSGTDTLSGTNPLKLHLDERVADIQTVQNYLLNRGRISDPIAGDNVHSWSSSPRLNGIYFTSFLTHSGLTVELIENFSEEEEHFSQLLKRNPRAVIISTTFIFFKDRLRRLTRRIRAAAPDIFIIAGGAFVYSSFLLHKRSGEPDYETRLAEHDYLFLQVDDEPDVDLYIISPHGEKTLVQVLSNLAGDRPLDGLSDTARLQGGSYLFEEKNADSRFFSHHIDWAHLPPSLFRSQVLPVQASCGCPHRCAFCNFSRDHNLSEVKPLEHLIAELKIIQQRSGRYAWFVDDNFRLGRNDLTTVCQRFIEEGIVLKWMCFIRAGTLLKTDIVLLRKAGCMEVQIGLESGDPAILNNMNKQANPEVYREVIGKLLHHGINVSCYFITGFPGETASSAERTRHFMRSIEYPEAEGSLSWSIYPFLLGPLSPVYEPAMRNKFGLSGYMHNWRHGTMDFNGAKKLALQAFLEMDNSGQIYRGDNQAILAGLSAKRRKRFYQTRHALAKKHLTQGVSPDEIIEAFNFLPVTG